MIETAPNAKPPVAKMMSLGKYRYEEEKAERRKRAKERKDIIKTVQIGFGAQLHDLEIRARQAEGFLESDYKVLIAMRLRGREKAHRDIAQEKLHTFLKLISVPLKVVQERQAPQGFRVLIIKE